MAAEKKRVAETPGMHRERGNIFRNALTLGQIGMKTAESLALKEAELNVT